MNKAEIDKVIETQIGVCRTAFVKANMPTWAIDRAIEQATPILDGIAKACKDEDRNSYRDQVNKLCQFIQERSARAWNSVPRPLPRAEGENIDEWNERCYIAHCVEPI